MATVTAKIRLLSKTSNGDGQTVLNFGADYDDGRNKEWSKYTPHLALGMTVTDEVAKLFPISTPFILTFEPDES